MRKIVGWHNGYQYCLKCLPKKPKDGYPIIFGHPDWSYGSVPICKVCKREITTIRDKYWYVIKTEEGFTSFLEAEDAWQARNVYTSIYHGKVVSARRATSRDWAQCDLQRWKSINR